jgi:homoserine O-acetyltransferase
MAATLETSIETRETPIPCERGVLRLPPLPLCGGSRLDGGELAWQAWGPREAPVTIVLGGISAGRDVGDWWRAQCGVGRSLDPRELRLVSIDWLGGADRSSGPRGGEAFPAIDTLDQAHAILALLNHLGVARVASVIGASYGGCVAQHLAVLLGNRLDRLVLIGAAHRASPWALALRHLQRAGIAAAGDDAAVQREALCRARALAVLAYRTPDELETRFGDEAPADGVLGWLQAHGERFARRFDAQSFLRLSASLDAHACDVARITARTTVVAFAEDLIVPIALAEACALRIPTACLVALHSCYGHDAFLKEVAAIAAVFEDVIRTECAA